MRETEFSAFSGSFHAILSFSRTLFFAPLNPVFGKKSAYFFHFLKFSRINCGFHALETNFFHAKQPIFHVEKKNTASDAIRFTVWFFPLKPVQAFKFLLSTPVVFERKLNKFQKLNRFFRKNSFIMLVCQFIWATKTIAIGTCLVVNICFTTSASRPAKQVVRASRIMVSAHNAEIPSWSCSVSISWGGRSHATMLRPRSSHELDSTLVALKLPVSIYFETILQFRARRLHTNPPHLFTFYLTHGRPFGFIQRAVSNFS